MMSPAVLVSKYRRGRVCIWENISSRMCFWVPWLTLTIRNMNRKDETMPTAKMQASLVRYPSKGAKSVEPS